MYPYLVFYTNFFIRSGFIGITKGPFILIKPKYKYDKGLLAHEKTHVKQFWRSFCLFPLIYTFSSVMRYKWEIEAYRVQLLYSNDHKAAAKRFAENFAFKYRLKVSKDKVYNDILN